MRQMREMEETQVDITRRMEEIPTQVYIGLTIGSILLSAFFFLMGRRQTANFIGLWAPTFGIMALLYKLLHPSEERPMEELREMGEEVRGRARRITR